MTLARVRLQLTAWYVAVLFAIVCVATSSAYFVLSRSLNAEVDGSLRSSARNIASQIEDRGVPSTDSRSGRSGDDRGRDGREDDDIEYFSGAGNDVFYLVLDGTGSVLQNPLNYPTSGAVDPKAVQAALAGDEAWRTFDSEDGGTRALFLAVGRGSDAVVIEVGRSLERHNRELADLLRVLLVTSGGGLVLAAVGGFLLAGRALRPTREAIERQRRFVADASHELRAPLTLIRASAEAIKGGTGDRLDDADRRSLEDVLAETENMRGLVNDLIALARLEEGRTRTELADVNAFDLLAVAAEEARVLGREKRLSIRTQAEPGLLLSCDHQKIAQVLRILADNAVRHSPPGGEVTLGAASSGDGAEVWVEDDGPGIPEEHRQHVFERFYRADNARSRDDGGSGLGLAIAREIVEAHGGQIEARERAGKPGAKIVFSLPVRRTSAR